MTDAPAVAAAPAPAAAVDAAIARDASGRFTAPASKEAAPVDDSMDFSTMSKTEMAGVLLKLVAANKETSTAAATAAEEAKKAAEERDVRLKQLEQKEVDAKKLEEEAQATEVATRIQELKDAGFGGAGLSDGLQRLSATDASTALKLMQVGVSV